MPLDSVLSRQALSTFRATLNLWKNAINTLVTDVDAVEADVATLQGEMTTAQADILLKQDASARSTLNYNYRGTALSTTCLNTDYNGLIHVTNLGATNFTLPAPSGLTNFRAGVPVILYNATTSSNDVTVVPSGCTYLGSTTIVAGECAYIVMINATTWARLAFTKG